MSDFLNFIIKPLLTKPEELVINENSGIINVAVATEDMGRIIGKHGVIITSLRNLVRVYCANHNLPLSNLNILEN